MPWLYLVRWKNLLIVFAAQLLAWYCLIYHSAIISGAPLLLRPVNFLLLSCSTLLITAAGYIINDYFDIKIDSINRPQSMVLVNKIPVRAAIIAHSLLNIAALALCGMVAAQAGHYEWVALQLACTVLLWFYSARLKRQFMTGNLAVSLLTALSIAVLVLYEPFMYGYIAQPVKVSSIGGRLYINPLWVAAGYCFFAFMLTWMREIVKDMEDYKGDEAGGCKTMPIMLGLRQSAAFAGTLCMVTALVLLLLAYRLLAARYFALGGYTCFFLAVPLLWWRYSLPLKYTPAHYRTCSAWLKVIMLLGIGSLIVYHLETRFIQ